MRKNILLIAIVLGIIASSCNSRTKKAVMLEALTPVLILDDSVQAINYKHIDELTVLTIAFTYNGENRTAITTDYTTAYATLVDSVEHDVAIGYFIKKKDIR